MLSRAARALAAATLVALAAAPPGPAAAGVGRADPVPQPSGGAGCDPTTNPWCRVEGRRPGGGTGGGSGCTWNGQRVPCTDPDFGFYVGGGCYWKAVELYDPAPPPAGADPLGTWGVRSCYTGAGVTQTYQWMPAATGGATPAALARQALAKIHLGGARIGITPDPGGSGAVGMPVWLWTAVTATTWGPLTATASAGPVTVAITARAYRIVWSMGDGRTVTCDNPGTPYEDRYGLRPSPTCGYRYDVPSATPGEPQGRYTVTATTYWRVGWSGGGQTGVLTPTSQSQTSIRVGEIPVVIR